MGGFLSFYPFAWAFVTLELGWNTAVRPTNNFPSLMMSVSCLVSWWFRGCEPSGVTIGANAGIHSTSPGETYRLGGKANKHYCS